MARTTLAAILTLSCALASMPAAAWKARIPNKAGDYITLTDRPCYDGNKQVKELAFASARAPGGKTLLACWAVAPKDALIYVFWRDGDISTYPTDAISEVEE